ncbi:YhjD/YihY/BrkB family envelope integrity protein [Mesomycoplasma conjunctivae]|uniref:YhjD/YihY/BrkB family envelope integrity protein n=1 Tax=Mesomycoplasma conjunctivae TaxID=45361 RepID=UPI003DA23C1E
MNKSQKYLKSILVKKDKYLIFTRKIWFWIIFIILKPFFFFISINAGHRKIKQKVSKNDLRDIVKKTLEKTSNKTFAIISVSQAFYILVSFIPILTLITILLLFLSKIVPSFVHNGKEWKFYDFIISEVLNKFIPGIQQSINFINNVTSKSVTNIAFLALLGSSFLIGANGYSRFINYYSLSYNHTDPINFWILKLKSFLIIIGIVIITTIFIYLSSLLFFVFKYWSLFFKSSILFYNIFFYFSSFVLLLLFFFVSSFLLLKYLPSFKLNKKWITPGVWIMMSSNTVFTFLFSLLVLNGWINYDKFGSTSTFLYLSTFSLYISQFYHFSIITNYSYSQKFFRKTYVSKWYAKFQKSYLSF